MVERSVGDFIDENGVICQVPVFPLCTIMIIIIVRGEVKIDKKYDYILLLLARVRVKNYFVWLQQFLVISLHLHSKLTTEAASESNSSKEEFVRMQ